MQITTADVVAEAGRMALELRFKDQIIDQLTAENAQLRGQLAERQGEGEPGE